MLAKKYRLLLNNTVPLKNSLSSPLFTMRYNITGQSFSRVGYIVSKKIDKRATERNRIKRLMSAGVEKMLGAMQPAADILFIVKKPIQEKTQQEIAIELEKKLQEAGIL